MGAVARIAVKDSPVQKMLRSKLKGNLQLTDLGKVSGIRDLVLEGFIGNEAERTERASAELRQFIDAGRFSEPEEGPERRRQGRGAPRVGAGVLAGGPRDAHEVV